jgi:hypothetical protein
MSQQAAEEYMSLTSQLGVLRKSLMGDSPEALDVSGQMDGPWHGMNESERRKATFHEKRVYHETCP